MNSQSLIAHASHGLNRAAAMLGTACGQYRAATAANPLGPGNLVATINAAFTPHGAADYDFHRASDYKSPLYHALADPTTLGLGDYLQPAAGTPYFVARLAPPAPTLVVACNRTITVSAPGATLAIGANPYAGSDLVNDQPFLTGWPASLLAFGRGYREETLPEDAGFGGFEILLPYFAGTDIRPGSIVTDDLGNRYIVQSAELQVPGWRLLTEQAVT